MSYLERTLSWFLKNRIFGGIQKLKQKEYLPFTLIILSITTITTIFALLYHLNGLISLISLNLIHFLLLLELFLSFGIILAGILMGRVKNLFLYFTFAFLIVAIFAFISIYFDWEYTLLFFRYSKLVYLLIWILISSISMFFLTLYFFTSFPKKVITLGMPKGHIFFGYLIKIIIYISIPLYILIILNFSLGSLILSTFGIITVIMILILLKRAPKKVESIPGIINFATAIGFFYIFMSYHLIMSFSSISTTFSSLIIDTIFLLIVVLFLVQSFTRRISETPTRLKSHQVPVRFQSRLYFTDRLKSIFGERGLVLVIMGIALGYHMAILDSFFKIDIPILPTFFTPNLELITIYHRIFLMCSLLTILIAIIVFKVSKRFKKFMIDKYTIKQVLTYIGGFFKRPEDSLSPFELGVQAMGKKIEESIKKLGDKWQDSIRKIVNGKDESED